MTKVELIQAIKVKVRKAKPIVNAYLSLILLIY